MLPLGVKVTVSVIVFACTPPPATVVPEFVSVVKESPVVAVDVGNVITTVEVP